MTSLFRDSKPVIGVIHVGALPGTPRGVMSVAELVRQATEGARVYKECGVDGVIIENMHDVPYLKGEVGPEIVAGLGSIGSGRGAGGRRGGRAQRRRGGGGSVRSASARSGKPRRPTIHGRRAKAEKIL